ncbi:ClpXP protease specificity-enhancing factor [Thiohalobacter thiocyanaticus]|uniref:ClpXP protease specificity-enhancing factor n=2 Tax=Thiohalobacter thiocyanaticus TaxID=585455 RepID=A0A426QN23_9GAMM|nr:ClpXP protease specificity-enhancing factor [Thiohalobacter thiocyanaticus]RRQ23137.1 ClpXP protease specificity-enhancing factor [Thiohalobacter thiocyanaticus]
MTPSRPYLIRAINEWIIDNGQTPYLLINADYPGAEVPRQFVDEGKIVLNINPTAVAGLELGNDYIMFSARFQGRAWEIVIPVPAVLAIYAQENGRGMMFNEEEYGPEPPDGGGPDQDKSDDDKGRPSLKVVK